MLKHKFSLRETILLCIAAVLALGIFYYEAIEKNYQKALHQYDTTNMQSEMDLLDVKEAKMRSMESYIEEHSDANQGEVAIYNNLANEIDALANILQPTASNVSIQWAEPYLTDTIVRRNADITCTVPSYVIAESVIDQIVNLQYKCIISSLSISSSDTMSVDTSTGVSVSMTVTFFETIDGAGNTNGLTEAQ